MVRDGLGAVLDCGVRRLGFRAESIPGSRISFVSVPTAPLQSRLRLLPILSA